MFRDLPPAGHRMSLASGGSPPTFEGYDAVWTQSGTAALAEAFAIARRRRPGVSQPVAVLPAYGCPDLVAAARFAGVRARLVDVGEHDPGYRLDRLEAALDDSVVAVVATSFLGVADRLAEIKALVRGAGDILLVEDDAQWYPEPAQRSLTGDLVVLSFGRGKPVTLLGGGALLVSSQLGRTLSPGVALHAGAAVEPARLERKAKIYNALMNPRLYWLASRNPMLSLGETHYKRLEGVHRLDGWRCARLASNVDAHLARPRDREAWISAELARIGAGRDLLLDLPQAVSAERRGRLLRYPVVFRSPAERDAVLATMRARGLGATAMYRRALPDIPGVAADVEVHSEAEGARSFASRLLTLPCHDFVRGWDVTAFGSILERFVSVR